MGDFDPNIGPDGLDKEAVYDSEIAPLVEQIIAICTRHEMPLLLSVVYRQSDGTGDGETSACTTHLPGRNGEFYDVFSESLRRIRGGNTGAMAITISSRRPV